MARIQDNFLPVAFLAAFALSSAEPAGAQDLTVQFELYSDAETLEQSLKMEFGGGNGDIIVTQVRPVPQPDDFVEEALISLLVELLGSGIDLLSLEDRRISDGPHARLSIDTTSGQNRLVHQQDLLFERLPRPALQLMQAFRPPGNEGRAFMAALADLQARHPSEMLEEFSLFNDDERRPDRSGFPEDMIAEIEYLRAELDRSEMRVGELEHQLSRATPDVASTQASPEAAPPSSVAAAPEKPLISELGVALTPQETTAPLSDAQLLERAEAARQIELLNHQIAALRRQSEELVVMLSVAEAKQAEADIRVQALGAQLNAALAELAAKEQ